MAGILLRIGGRLDPSFRGSLSQSQQEAEKVGRAMEAAMSRGHGASGGIVSEMLVMARELARGNFTRLPGSFTILAQRMNLLKLIVRDNTTAARTLAEGYKDLAVKTSGAAVAASQKAASSAAAFMADESATEATLESAAADEAKAVAARSAATAMRTKAMVAEQDAVAMEAETAATAGAVTGFGLLAAGVVAVTMVAWEGYKIWKLYRDTLTEITNIGGKSFRPEYVAKKDRSENAPIEIQKQINDEIEKSVQHYNSAESAAKRVEEATRAHYDTLRKINELNKERDLAGARSPGERADVEKHYADVADDTRRAESKQELANLYAKRFNLQVEGEKFQRQANGVKVTTREEDQNRLTKLRVNAENAQKFLDDTAGGDTHKAFRIYNDAARNATTALTLGIAGKGLLKTGISDDEIMAQVADARSTASQLITQYHGGLEAFNANEELRRKKSDLAKSAATSQGAAAATSGEITDKINTNADEDADSDAIRTATDQTSDAKEDQAIFKENSKIHKPKKNLVDRHSAAGIGVGMSGPQIAQISNRGFDGAGKEIHSELKGLRKDVQALGKSGGKRVDFGGGGF